MRPALLALFVGLIATPALAGLNFCNKTGSNISVAIGYSDDGTWTSEGWWTAKSGDCTTPVGGDLKKRYYYYRITSPDIDFPTEDFYFCTSSKEFTIVGDTECQARGYDRNAFLELDTGDAKDWTVNVTADDGGDPGQASLEQEYQETYDYVFTALQGVWIDSGDDSIAMRFADNRLIDYFAGVEAGAGNWSLADTCDGARGGGPVLIINYDEFANEPLCWVITELDLHDFRFRAVNGGNIHMVKAR